MYFKYFFNKMGDCEKKILNAQINWKNRTELSFSLFSDEYSCSYPHQILSQQQLFHFSILLWLFHSPISSKTLQASFSLLCFLFFSAKDGARGKKKCQKQTQFVPRTHPFVTNTHTFQKLSHFVATTIKCSWHLCFEHAKDAYNSVRRMIDKIDWQKQKNCNQNFEFIKMLGSYENRTRDLHLTRMTLCHLS